jgi:hypothetical protein
MHDLFERQFDSHLVFVIAARATEAHHSLVVVGVFWLNTFFKGVFESFGP